VDYLNSQELHQGYIFVKSDYQMVKIFLKDIIYIEGLDDYIKIYLSQRSVLTLMTLKTIMQRLPAREFIRVHRSYIVPVSRIDHISKSKIRIGEKEIPIGISYSEGFFSAMEQRLQ
jgi:DNA-binding LytR/AlgR family response regulator